jgi:hypothetical protein
MTFPKFHWGNAPPEEKPQPTPDSVLHEPAYIVMKLNELTSKDQEYLAQNLESMLADVDLQDAWSRVHIGQPVSKYRSDLKAVAAEWKRSHPTIDPSYTLHDKYVVEPTSTGVNVYLPTEWKNRGKPDESVKVDNPWLVAPPGTDKKGVIQLIGNQQREDKILDENRKIRDILSGRK